MVDGHQIATRFCRWFDINEARLYFDEAKKGVPKPIQRHFLTNCFYDTTKILAQRPRANEKHESKLLAPQFALKQREEHKKIEHNIYSLFMQFEVIRPF